MGTSIAGAQIRYGWRYLNESVPFGYSSVHGKIDRRTQHHTNKFSPQARAARIDTDAYVWVNRLLASGFEQYDYMGYCDDAKQKPYSEDRNGFCRATAHGGIGFTLSRRAMEIIIKAPIERYADDKFWGDLWAGHQLWKQGILCKRDTRFLDGSGSATHHGNIFASELPLDHQYVSVHPVPAENMYDIHERFAALSAETTPPERQLW